MERRIIRLQEFEIELEIRGDKGTITRCFNVTKFPDTSDDLEFAERVLLCEGVETLILAHAMAGVDVASPEYISGIRSAYANMASGNEMPLELVSC